MKKVFISISAVFLVVVVTLLVSLNVIKKSVYIENDKPSVIRVYNESTNPVKNEGYKPADAEYEQIYQKLKNTTSLSLFDRLTKFKTLDSKLELSKDGTFVKYNTELKNKNLVIEYEFSEEQDLVVYDGGHTRVISYWCLSFVISKKDGLNDIVVYHSNTNESDGRIEEYAKCMPIVIKGVSNNLIDYINTLKK